MAAYNLTVRAFSQYDCEDRSLRTLADDRPEAAPILGLCGASNRVRSSENYTGQESSEKIITRVTGIIELYTNRPI